MNTCMCACVYVCVRISEEFLSCHIKCNQNLYSKDLDLSTVLLLLCVV